MSNLVLSQIDSDIIIRMKLVIYPLDRKWCFFLLLFSSFYFLGCGHIWVLIWVQSWVQSWVPSQAVITRRSIVALTRLGFMWYRETSETLQLISLPKWLSIELLPIKLTDSISQDCRSQILSVYRYCVCWIGPS